MLPRIVSIMISPAFNVYKVVVNVVGLRYLKYQVSVWYFIPPLLGVTDHEGGGEGEKQESRSGVGHGTPLVSSCLTVSLSHSLMSPGPPHRNLRSCWGRGQKGEGERWEPWDRTNSPHTSHLTPHTSHLTPDTSHLLPPEHQWLAGSVALQKGRLKIHSSHNLSLEAWGSWEDFFWSLAYIIAVRREKGF